jgi:hypothetical protein
VPSFFSVPDLLTPRLKWELAIGNSFLHLWGGGGGKGVGGNQGDFFIYFNKEKSHRIFQETGLLIVQFGHVNTRHRNQFCFYWLVK